MSEVGQLSIQRPSSTGKSIKCRGEKRRLCVRREFTSICETDSPIGTVLVVTVQREKLLNFAEEAKRERENGDAFTFTSAKAVSRLAGWLAGCFNDSTRSEGLCF